MAETKSGVLIVPRLNAIVNEPDLRVAILGSVQNMTLEMYVQESGRGGRGGEPKVAVLYCSRKQRT